jgi:PKD repeat protein
LELTELSLCGQYLAEYDGEPGSGDVEWYLDGALMQTGGGAFDFSLDSAEVAVLCVVATGEACPEGEEVCIEVENAGCDPCLTEEEAELMSWPVDEEAPCLVSLLLEMMQPDGYSIFWEFGDGITTTNAYLWTEHQYAESGTYEVCATVFSPGCPEGATWCIEVVVEGCDSDCEPVVVTVEPNGASGFYSWTGYGDEWSEDDTFLIPGGTVEPLELGLCLTDGCYVMDFVGSGDSDPAGDLIISVSDEDGTIEWESEPFVDENGWQVIQFGVGEVGCDLDDELCTLEIEAVEEADGSWTLTAVTESEEEVDFLWVLSDGSALNGVSINHTFVNGVEVVTACVSALFPECGEVLSACIDLENGLAEGCEAVEVELDGETFVELLEDLELTWSLFGEDFDLSGSASLDPAQGGLDGLVLCLPPGCYALSMDMEGLPGFQGLPGMTLSLSVGEEQQLELDLMLIDDVIELEFGVFTDCGFSVGSPSGPAIEGLRVYPNPAGDVARVEWVGAPKREAFQWSLCDGLGRVVERGTARGSVWDLPISRQVAGGYILVVESGVDVRRKRVMVARR